MKKNALSVSVVVPVYNDATYIKDCIDALMLQSVAPNEIIVVDNNCSDNSIKIAKLYRKVKIIKERRQGLSFARNAGFNVAHGDLLLRIDADTILPHDYVAILITLANKFPKIVGFTGYGISRYEFLPKISLPWSWVYFKFSHAYLGYPMLWGANMAIRRDIWAKTKPLLLNNDLAVHEDQDLSLAIASVGGTVRHFRELTVSVYMQKLLEYQQYRKYGLMLHLLKVLDMQHYRYRLPTRLPKTPMIKRALFWLLTAWSVYAFYLVTMVYWLKKRLFES